MMRIKCIAVDDEPDALEKLCSYIRRIPFLELVGACEDAFEAMEVLGKNKVDAIFIDINMPDLNGLEFVSTLSLPPKIVFITAYEEYAVASYSVKAVDYILKPYGFAEFQRAATRLLPDSDRSEKIENEEVTPKSIYVKVDSRWVRINMEDIAYIQSYGDYLKIFIVGQSNSILTNSNFASISQILSDNFIQIHRSYMVNMDRINEIERGRIKLSKDICLPVGDLYKSKVMEYIETRGVRKYRKNNLPNK
ncbi:MAG: response regulator transcription factor [Bacteroides sp.]|nr:response regulator transcription factor [Bacteroides sp.]